MTLPLAYGAAAGGGALHSWTELEQLLVGVTWIDSKPVFQKTIDTGALPNATSKNVAHGITGLETLISIEGIALNSGGSTHVQLGRPTAGGLSQVTVNVNATNITIVTDADLTANAASHVTLVYTKA